MPTRPPSPSLPKNIALDLADPRCREGHDYAKVAAGVTVAGLHFETRADQLVLVCRTCTLVTCQWRDRSEDDF